jgi:REP element-mobilizing transposase RayT
MKPGSFTQLYVQLVFAVKNRDAVLHKSIRGRIFEYMSGIITEMKHKSIIVNGVSDHVHIFIGLNPNISISETVHDVKRSSSLFINKEKLCLGNFAWQEGYGAFSYSRSHIDEVYKYILNQEKHHTKTTFKTEYIKLLEKFEVEYDERYLFEFF